MFVENETKPRRREKKIQVSVNCKLTKSLVVIKKQKKQTQIAHSIYAQSEREDWGGGKKTLHKEVVMWAIWMSTEEKKMCKKLFCNAIGEREERERERKKCANEKCLWSKWNLRTHIVATAFCLTNWNMQFITLRIFFLFVRRLLTLIKSGFVCICGEWKKKEKNSRVRIISLHFLSDNFLGWRLCRRS